MSDPDRSAGPRLSFSGCALGNALLVRYDVPDSLASKLLDAAAQEPPWSDPERDPACVAELTALLSTARPVKSVEMGVNCRLPNAQPYAHGFPIVRSDSTQGAMLAARFAKDGMPKSMIDAGFRSIADLWPPWCIARERGSEASGSGSTSARRPRPACCARSPRR